MVRLSIAQVLTVIRQTQKKTLREAYATKARTARAALSTARHSTLWMRQWFLWHSALITRLTRSLSPPAEVHAAGPAPQEDPRHPPATDQDAVEAGDGEGQEEGPLFPIEPALCSQGMSEGINRDLGPSRPPLVCYTSQQRLRAGAPKESMRSVQAFLAPPLT